MGSALIDAVNAAYPAMAGYYASDWAALEAEKEGYFVLNNCVLSANASTLSSVSRSTGNNTFDKTAHGLVAGDSINFSGLSNTTGVTNGTLYYVVSTGLTANAFRVATTVGGTALTLGGTTDSSITVTQVGKIDMTYGTVHCGTVEVLVAASTAYASTITSLADATNPKWVALEIDSAGALQHNDGTAAATPVKPALTAGRTLIGWLYIPAGATLVDALLSNANGKAKIMDARIIRIGPTPGGWVWDQNTWVYVSANSFKIVGKDVTAQFPKGAKVCYGDGGGTDYGFVYSSALSGSDTLVTLFANDDYAIANATLTRPRYSVAESPIGFPTWFNWTPTTISGWSANPTNMKWMFTCRGNTCYLDIVHGTAGTSNNATHTATLPGTAATQTGGWQCPGIFVDNGTVTNGYGLIASAGTTVSLRGLTAGGNNTASGSSRVVGLQMKYEF